MSYQQAIRKLFDEVAVSLGSNAEFEVAVARPGSFLMKVIVKDRGQDHECVFDLAAGMTPRTSRSIREWLEQALSQADDIHPVHAL